MQKKRNKIRVVYHPQKYIKPVPNCPHCHNGFLEMREYVEVATEERDEERSWVGYCPRCEWIVSEEEAQQSMHPTLGSLPLRVALFKPQPIPHLKPNPRHPHAGNANR